VVIHESDAIAGLANRRAAKSASSVAVSFPPESMDGLPRQKLVYTGSPLRDGVIKGSAERARKQFKLDRKLPVVLVLCGSQGSTAINRLVWEALPLLLPDTQVIHQVGERNLADVQAETADLPADLKARYHPRGYLKDELFDLYAVADLVVGRAGSGIAELAATGLPSVLIPLPSAASDHQRHNAAVFELQKAALVLEESELTAESLNNAIKRLLKNQQRLAEMSRNARSLARFDATQQLADLIWQTGAHRE
jgi:UDP-N-acetylglucosamine--N-acetylmuramyl-(pentapeptide) pyrophosphoryl-undecaprenol N-acetylglucosamine transferase